MTTYETFKMHMQMLQQEQKQKLQVKKLRMDAIVPTRGTPVAAGLDLYAVDDGNLMEREHALVGTGIAIALPPGYEGQVRPRSGLAAKHGISVVNTPGTIDEDYRGELKVILINHGTSRFTWSKGERIAQLVITRANYFDVDEVEELDTTDRGSNGFGSTGR